MTVMSGQDDYAPGDRQRGDGGGSLEHRAARDQVWIVVVDGH